MCCQKKDDLRRVHMSALNDTRTFCTKGSQLQEKRITGFDKWHNELAPYVTSVNLIFGR